MSQGVASNAFFRGTGHFRTRIALRALAARDTLVGVDTGLHCLRPTPVTND